MAGATAGATTMFATTATRLTWPDSAATTGVHTSCAASGTATASAAQRGSQARSWSRKAGARKRMPAVASTESTKPNDRASHGSTSSNVTVATPRARTPWLRPWVPIPTSATVPIAAARTTLGSARATSTKPTTPSPPTSTRPRARTPAQRASTSSDPTTSVRFVPDTAARWVSPQVRKSSTTACGIRRSSPDDQGRHEGAGLGAAPGQRSADPRPHRLGPVEQATGVLDDHGLPAARQHRRGGQVVRWRQPAGHLDGLAERHRCPARVADHQHARRGRCRPGPGR